MAYEEESNKMAKLLSKASVFKLDGYLYHVLGIYDKTHIAVKYFGKHKQFWHYEFLDAYLLYLHYINDELVIKDNKRTVL